MFTRVMSVSQWIAIPDNPIQRDTQRHAARAKHLTKPLPIHALVTAAQLPDASLVKLDGHTRAYLWKLNQIPHPPEVHCNIIQVNSMDEAVRLYTTIDSRDALETTNDKVSGAFNQLKFQPESALLARGSIATALRMCWAIQHGRAALSDYSTTDRIGYSVYLAVQEFANELFALDALNLANTNVQTGVVGAFILTFRKHGPKILPFWKAVFADAGERKEGKMDAVQALNELRLIRRGKHAGSSATHDLMARAVCAAEHWLRGNMLGSIPRPYNIDGYIDTARPAYTLIKQTAA